MDQRFKAGNFYLDVRTAASSLANHPGAEKPLISEKSDMPEPLEAKPLNVKKSQYPRWPQCASDSVC